MHQNQVFYIAEAMTVDSELNDANERKIQEAIDLYWKAREYPRKKKKKMRKEALADYNFFMALKDFIPQFY